MEMVQREVPNIMMRIAEMHPHLKLRVAVVGYSDYDCCPPVEVLDFVEYFPPSIKGMNDTLDLTMKSGRSKLEKFRTDMKLRNRGKLPLGAHRL